jgi:NADPH:quinone reductase-like Zn-dependent oxidoreductase
MRVVVCDRYGPPDVLRLEEVAKPTPQPDEVLVRVRATTVNRTDCGIRAGEPLVSRLISGLRRPKWRILGTELAGTVEAAGAAVTQFTVGEEVFGVNAWHFGAHAEFVCVRAGGPLAGKPAGLSFEEAAAVCDGAILALGCLRPADVRNGRSVLIYGASGSIGTAAVQAAHGGGKYRAVIDRRYPLADVIDATRYVETKQKTGNVILTVGQNFLPRPA